MVHVIAYDLKSPNDTEEDYQRVIEGLKASYGTWCHLEKSVWLAETEQGAGEVRDAIRKFLHDSDVLFVARLQGNWGSYNLGPNRAQWVKSRTF